MEKVVVDPEFWKGARVLVTGHTGFKGSWLSIWLNEMGASVVGCALAPASERDLFAAAKIADLTESHIVDIRDRAALAALFHATQPEVVFHLAAQSLVIRSYHDPVETYETNVLGTLNVLEAVRSTRSVNAAVIVTTDKCYENRESNVAFRESDRLGGHDPYSSSKACAEILVSSYRASFFDPAERATPRVATARAGNVIGGGDWSENRLIPDIMRSIYSGDAIVVRNPDAVRPWQHVLESLSGYLILAEALSQGRRDCERGWNFGPDEGDAKPVRWLVEQIRARAATKPECHYGASPEHHEAGTLRLDSSDAHACLGWSPRWGIAETIENVASWYFDALAGANPLQLCKAQIAQYTSSR